jgi:pyruvate carboxylase subunit B
MGNEIKPISAFCNFYKRRWNNERARSSQDDGHELRQGSTGGGKSREGEDLTLRDGHQSLFATRGRTEDMIPVAEMMDEVGFWAVETWGGATFDTMHRFLNEDPWERIRTLKRYIKKTPFSMLLRAQNLVGYRNYADDVAKAFVDRACENGMDIFRTFDALNDYRNFETVVPKIKEYGKHFQGCICYTMTEPRLGGEVYNLDYYVNKAKDLEAMGADSICIKDMAGLIAPYDAYEIVKALKAAVKVPIHLHSHFTSGMSPMSHLKAIEAGVDIIDTCMTPYAYRTSHAAIEPLVMTLLGTNRDTGFDIRSWREINEILEKEVMPKYKHLLDDSKVSIIDINVLLHQTPGGMLSNLVNQLREMDALDKIDEVYKELPRVRKELGQIPLVTPTSQIVGIQTVNNVLFRRRERALQDDHRPGQGPVLRPVRQDRRAHRPGSAEKSAQGLPRGEEPITCRPAEVLEPELKRPKEEIGTWPWIWTTWSVCHLPGHRQEISEVEIRQGRAPRRGQSHHPGRGQGKEDELVKKAKAGLLVEKAKLAPAKSENLRTFNVFVDDDYFEVGVDEVGGSPVISYMQQPCRQACRRPAAPPAAAPGPGAQPLRQPPAGTGGRPPHPRRCPAPAPAAVDGTPLPAPMPGMIVSYQKGGRHGGRR